MVTGSIAVYLSRGSRVYRVTPIPAPVLITACLMFFKTP